MTSSARALRQPGPYDDEQFDRLLGVGFTLSPLPAVLLDDGVVIITAANRNAAELALGSGPQSLLGRCFTDLLAPMQSAQFTPAAAALGAGAMNSTKPEERLDLTDNTDRAHNGRITRTGLIPDKDHPPRPQDATPSMNPTRRDNSGRVQSSAGFR